ncbi:MAG: hypothetical protein OXJ90_10295 [Spirochaetaceae bacterium]|nr:hypothetical protein [Spirochaetaceae bacterium]
MKSVDVRRISVASSYLPDVEAMFVSFIEQHGVCLAHATEPLAAT